jgi:hypothetical protein
MAARNRAPDEPHTSAEHPPAPVDVERQFLDAERRARRYWYEDGLGEVAVGAIFALLGAYFAVQASLAGRLTRLGDVLLNLLFPIIVITAGLGMRTVIGKVKERLVYPRAGYATYHEKRRLPKWVAGTVAGTIAGLVAVLARTAPGIEAWLPVCQGSIVGAFLWWLGRSSGLARFSLLALLAVLLGVVVALAGTSSTVAAALFFGPVGLLLVLSGWLAFRPFVRATGGAGER